MAVRPFSALDPSRQGRLVQAVFDADRRDRAWHGRPGSRVRGLWTRYARAAFYPHPWSWDGIGFGGPAYPRGHRNTGVDAGERWEVADASGADPAASDRAVDDARADHEHLTGVLSAACGTARAQQRWVAR